MAITQTISIAENLVDDFVNNKVGNISLTNPGANYTFVPNVTIGAFQTTLGTQATAEVSDMILTRADISAVGYSYQVGDILDIADTTGQVQITETEVTITGLANAGQNYTTDTQITFNNDISPEWKNTLLIKITRVIEDENDVSSFGVLGSKSFVIYNSDGSQFFTGLADTEAQVIADTDVANGQYYIYGTLTAYNTLFNTNHKIGEIREYEVVLAGSWQSENTQQPSILLVGPENLTGIANVSGTGAIFNVSWNLKSLSIKTPLIAADNLLVNSVETVANTGVGAGCMLDLRYSVNSISVTNQGLGYLSASVNIETPTVSSLDSDKAQAIAETVKVANTIYTNSVFGSGYYQRLSGISTLTWDLEENTTCNVIIQGTLKHEPMDTDWADLVNISFPATQRIGTDKVLGHWVKLRAKIDNLTTGVINNIKITY